MFGVEKVIDKWEMSNLDSIRFRKSVTIIDPEVEQHVPLLRDVHDLLRDFQQTFHEGSRDDLYIRFLELERNILELVQGYAGSELWIQTYKPDNGEETQ